MEEEAKQKELQVAEEGEDINVVDKEPEPAAARQPKRKAVLKPEKKHR
mgnify:CR=1 FL=1